jgi:hypothetical protein
VVSVIVALALTPLAVAVIFALPAATPVTTPDALTFAMPGLSLDHATLGDAIAFPMVSTTLAARVTDLLTTTDAVAGVTEMVGFFGAGLADTSTTAFALCAPAMAIMSAFPGLRAVTTPLLSTVAMVVSDETQTTGCPSTEFP